MSRTARTGATIDVGIKRLDHGADLPLPDYQSALAAGFDVMAAIPNSEPLRIPPGERVAVPTGFSLELPAGYECQARPRSGLALKHGITVLNAPGTIDADYRGEVKIILINHGNADFEVARGDRIAQLVVQPVVQAQFKLRETLSETERGSGGFGSTGHQRSAHQKHE
ncbi:deoxyuridine 5'-triphosphate nucleotidohydrolase [bacterium MnTg02]|nr:deoxyuridine 5'-triphosphate nucleotidohydrolase [bacterium MnTg02]